MPDPDFSLPVCSSVRPCLHLVLKCVLDDHRLHLYTYMCHQGFQQATCVQILLLLRHVCYKVKGYAHSYYLSLLTEKRQSCIAHVLRTCVHVRAIAAVEVGRTVSSVTGKRT